MMVVHRGNGQVLKLLVQKQIMLKLVVLKRATAPESWSVVCSGISWR
ncbi:hypothetical protein [Pectobacterium polaris]|nr:hypothetical protein [Pectobacterium polaris]MCA6953480.1 hypothetical protein [Pectobacterium polaris]